MSRFLSKPIILGMSLVELCGAFVAITMPFGNNLNSYSIALFCLLAVLSNSFREKIANLRKNNLSWILPITYFLWIALSSLWDKSPNKSFKYLETEASLLLFPLVLGQLGSVSRESLKKILIIFVLTNIVAALYCLWKAYLEYQMTHYLPFFFYHYLSKHIGISAIYFSNYCVFSLVTLYYYFFMQKSRMVAQLLAFLGILILVVFTIMLSSKMFIFILYVSGIGICMYSFITFKNNRLRPMIIAIVLIAIPAFMVRLPYVYSRITETQVKEYAGVEDDHNGFAVRRLLWKKSWKLITQHPIVGSGYYTAHDNLQKEYREAGFEEGVKQNYNSHNQYLFSWLCYGLPGIVLLIGFMVQFLLTSFTKREFLGVYILLLYVLSMTTDCMLEIQKGIVFLMFFGGLFVFNSYSLKERAASA